MPRGGVFGQAVLRVGRAGYRGGMTSEGGSEDGPTLADVLAAINAVAAVQREHGETLAGHGTTLGALSERSETQGEALTGLKADLEGLRFDFAARSELDEARHNDIMQILETVSDMAHAHHAQLAGLPEDIGGDIRAAEARVTSRLEDLRRAVHALKTDFVRHANNPDAHHGHAA